MVASSMCGSWSSEFSADEADFSGKVHRVDHLACQQSNFAEHGLCDVESFVESQAYAVSGGDWDERCYE